MAEPYKWKVLSVNANNEGMTLLVDFAYGWKVIKQPQYDEEGNAIGETETWQSTRQIREKLTSPVVLTQEQIKQWLNTYWANKYMPLDALQATVLDAQTLIGYQEEY